MWTHILYVGAIFTWGDSIWFCRQHVAHLDAATTISKIFSRGAQEVRRASCFPAEFWGSFMKTLNWRWWMKGSMSCFLCGLQHLLFFYEDRVDWKMTWNRRIFKNSCYALMWTPSGGTSEIPPLVVQYKFQQGGDKYSAIRSPPFFLLSSYTCGLFHVQSR